MASDNADILDFDKSELGTKEHWDAIYERDLALLEEGGDGGDTWFGDHVLRATVRAVVGLCKKDARVLDVGCGNGQLAIALAEKGFSKVTGTDYSDAAIKICDALADEAEDYDRSCITFLQDDIFATRFAPADFDVVVDKGTLDAISLNKALDDPRAAYRQAVHSLLSTDGHLVITSCNYTEAELKTVFSTGFEFVSAVEYPKFKFGGAEGTSVCTLCFKRV